MKNFEKFPLLGVSLTNVKEREVLEFIITGLEKQTEKYYIVTPNPELLVIADKDPKYKDILNRAKLALVDGIGIVWAVRLLGHPLIERIHGVNLLESLCSSVAKQPITVGFLGAGPSVAEKTAECLKKKYPGLKVGLVSQEWSDSLKNNKVDILFVAFGSPKQEIWISEHINNISARVLIGVGGSFDFISGKVPRAPKFLRQLGLEWLFRLIIQPWRIKRQMSLLKFVYLVLKEKFNKD
jgi:N-acetylglucosaminyldiphosphoundecaprenol N-acetyl-beta-D-mannosaminyltransferase